MGVCNCSIVCCTLLYVHSSIAIILMGKRELVALLNLSSWCLVMVERIFLAVQLGCLRFVIVVFPDHTHLLLLNLQTTSDLSMLSHCVISPPDAMSCDKIVLRIWFIFHLQLIRVTKNLLFMAYWVQSQFCM